MNKPVISVKNLNVDYISSAVPVNAVRDVTFEVYSGEIFGLVGESGSGKSTVVQAMMRILPPPALIKSGIVSINDKDILEFKVANVLKNKEKSEGFDEALYSNEERKKKIFFNLGFNNRWKKLLKEEIKEKIEIEFNKEMRELGYL